MDKAKSFKELSEDAQSSDVEILELFIERSEAIQKDLGELIKTMDRVRLDRLAAKQPTPQDFLAMKGSYIKKKE